MSVNAKINLDVTAEELLATGIETLDDVRHFHNVASPDVTLNAGSTPPATVAYSDEVQLSAGAYTIDLTALPGALGTTRDFSGLKIQAIKIVANSQNTAAVTVDVGAVNGYNWLGSASAHATLGPGEAVAGYFVDTLPDISGTASDIDLGSADPDARVTVLLVAG